MRSFHSFWLAVVILLLPGSPAQAAEFKLSNGSTLRGEISSMTEDGLAVRLDTGGFSERVAWGQLTQETLKQLLTNPQAKDFVEPFIEIPASERIKRKEINIKEVPRVERPEDVKGLVSGLATPAGVTLLAVLLLANLYAAYEIAVFRNRPAALVCGLSAVLPILGPILFLAMPAGHPEARHVEEEADDSYAEGAGGAGKKTTAAVAGKPSGLSIAGGKGEAVAGPDLNVYTRGNTTFNRRFFETKFPGFFRVVPSEAEKDLVLTIKTPKNDYVARRISRISMNEIHVQLLKGGAAEVSLSFGEIIQAQVRHKDAKA